MRLFAGVQLNSRDDLLRCFQRGHHRRLWKGVTTGSSLPSKMELAEEVRSRGAGPQREGYRDAFATIDVGVVDCVPRPDVHLSVKGEVRCVKYLHVFHRAPDFILGPRQAKTQDREILPSDDALIAIEHVQRTG